MRNLSIDQRELRRQILHWLAPRHPLAHLAATIARRVGHAIGEALTKEHVVPPLEFLVERGFVRKVPDGVSGDDCYAATANGVVEWENQSGG